MKKILIHIGTSKTGSSSIQKTLNNAAQKRELYPIIYPRKGGSSHGLISAIYNPPDKFTRTIKQQYDTNKKKFKRNLFLFKKRLFKEIEKNDNIIISSEFLFSLTPEAIKNLKQDLYKLGVNEIEVIVYVRKPSSHYLSIVQQKIKASHIIHNPLTYNYKLKENISNWESEFPGKVQVRPFEKSLLYNNDVVQDLLHVASDYFSVNLKDIELMRQNESISGEGMVILQNYRKLFHSYYDQIHKTDSNKILKYLQTSTEEITQTKPTLQREVETTINNNHREDLDWLYDNYGIYFDKDNNSSPLIKSDLERVEDILDNYNEDTVQRLLYYLLYSSLNSKRASLLVYVKSKFG
ncbi:hypothetical protein D7Z54_29525 [Salibacterium salarium]|uniref:Sulfotransferase family protein n=1 Tax=Salibacterium salarium TaxID=284579 RepID=A0A3R9QG65_9BACI|nr:hypothetical protein [Salibacterium salarium]RSL29774.1 hypothetical protein D7Z54_29525 [Salibacterium salarium]